MSHTDFNCNDFNLQSAICSLQMSHTHYIRNDFNFQSDYIYNDFNLQPANSAVCNDTQIILVYL